MDYNIFAALLKNATLLMALAAFQTLFTESGEKRVHSGLRRLGIGLGLGLLGMSLILSSYELRPGIVFDTRSVLLGLSGLFFGTIPTVVAMLMTAALRLFQGGAAAWTGVFVILMSGGTGLLWRRKLRNAPEQITWKGLYLLGMAIHLAMLALMFTLPFQTALTIVSQIATPVLLIYPFTFVAVGLLLKHNIAHRQTASALAENEATYRNLFENNHATMLLIDPATEEIVDGNPAAARFYGWSREELRSMRISQINTLPPERLAVEIQRALSGECTNFEFRHRRASGDECEVEVLSGKVFMGGRNLLCSIVQDITERKEFDAARTRLLDELSCSRERLRTTLHSIGDAVISVDCQELVLFMNPVAVALTGWTEREAIGRPLREIFRIINEGTRRTVENPVDEVLKSGTIVGLANHTLLLARDGREIPIADSAAPIMNQGQIQGVVLVFRDQTRERTARRALEESERNYSSLVAHLPGIAYRCTNDADWTMEFISQGCEQLTGYAAEDLVGNNAVSFSGLIHPEDRQTVWDAVQDAVEHRTPYEIEYRIVTKQKTEKWVWEKGAPRFADDGALLHLSGFIADITDRKLAKERLELVQYALEHAADPAFWVNPDGSLAYANKAACKALGYSREELLRLSIPDIDPDFDPRRWPRHWASMKTKGAFEIETRHRTKTGEVFPVEIHGNYIAFADREYHFTFAHNIAARKKTLEQLQRLSTAIEQSPDAVVITDLEGRIEYVNPAFEKNSGYAAAEAVGQTPRILKSGLQDAAFYANLWNTILSGKTWNGRIVNRRKNGSIFTEEARILPVRDPDGRIANFMGLKRDVTKELEMEEAVRQSQKMEAIGQLAGGIAHDFNNILQAVMGFGQLLQIDLEMNSPQYGHAEEILKAARRATQLTSQLLAFGRNQPAQPDLMDLNATIRDMEVLLHVLLGEKYDLVLELDANLYPIRADHGQMTQIIMNLAINARDAMPVSGRLMVATDNLLITDPDVATLPGANPGAYVCVSVTDTGSGMDPAVKDRIFEPFFTTKDIGKGSGLGLSVVYGIVKQNKGWIHVYSEKGQGSSFKIYIPAMAPPAEPGQHGHSGNILLVEDDVEVAAMAATILECAGYRVVCVSSAEDALALFGQDANAFDLLICDMVLPGMDGGALADAVRRRHPTLPILLCSGYRDLKDRWKHLNLKDYHFTHKPFTETSLLDTIKKLLTTTNR